MRMALTVYEDGKPGKVYEADDTRLTVGVCEDVLRMTRADLLMDSSSEDAQNQIAKAVLTAFMDFYPVIRQIFPGITEDEYRQALPREVGAVMMGIVAHSISELSQIGAGDPQKNRKGRKRPCTTPYSGSPSRYATGSRL